MAWLFPSLFFSAALCISLLCPCFMYMVPTCLQGLPRRGSYLLAETLADAPASHLRTPSCKQKAWINTHSHQFITETLVISSLAQFSFFPLNLPWSSIFLLQAPSVSATHPKSHFSSSGNNLVFPLSTHQDTHTLLIAPWGSIKSF